MADVAVTDWHIHPFRTESWLEAWEPVAARALAYGASGYSLTRSEEDPLHFRQATTWEDRADFDRYWYSEDVARAREEVINLYNKPLLTTWHALVASE